MEFKENLLKLSSLTAVGNITDAADFALSELSKYADTKRIGNLNIVGEIKGKSDYTLLIDAHIDQIAMVVTDIDENGFLTVAKCGGIDIRTLPARPVTVHGKRDITAVFCSTPPHLSKGDKEYTDISEIKLDSMLSKNAKDIISVGDYVTYASFPCEMLNNTISGKSLDDRAGVACILELAKRLKGKELPISVAFLISDMEELGLRGARTAAYKINPNEAIAIDVSFGDGPDISPMDTGKVKGGAMIGISPVLSSDISGKLTAIAKEKEIPYQLEVMGGTTSTNADVISVNREGVKTGLVSIPLRNMHTEVEILNIDDLLSVCDILENYILSGGVLNAQNS